MNQRPAITPSIAPVLPKAGRVGRFCIERELGRGTNGIVYLSRDPIIDREVAIKTFNPDLSTLQRKGCEEQFINEARAAGRLSHPHIVTIYEASCEGGATYVAMEYLKGKPLSKMIEDKHVFRCGEIAAIFWKIADALAYAHDKGVIHRDIKPANIFMVGDKDPQLVDFGIARAPNRVPGMAGNGDAPYTMYHKATLLGTPAYMSPEQALQQQTDARSDVYSLGAVMYELLTGRKPFVAGDVGQLLDKIAYKAPKQLREINPMVPDILAGIVMRAMAKRPEKRYQSAAGMADDIRKFMAAERRARTGARHASAGSVAVPKSLPPQKTRFYQKTIFWPGCAVGVMSIALLGIALYKPLASVPVI